MTGPRARSTLATRRPASRASKDSGDVDGVEERAWLVIPNATLVAWGPFPETNATAREFIPRLVPSRTARVALNSLPWFTCHVAGCEGAPCGGSGHATLSCGATRACSPSLQVPFRARRVARRTLSSAKRAEDGSHRVRRAPARLHPGGIVRIHRLRQDAHCTEAKHRLDQGLAERVGAEATRNDEHGQEGDARRVRADSASIPSASGM